MQNKENVKSKSFVIALAGQPNCGKSTLFNAIAGFKAITANFPGTSVNRTESAGVLQGQEFKIIDLPGTYSLSVHDPVELITRDYLLSGDMDVVIAVVDASVLTRSLELVLELIEIGTPLVLALNMMDEAQRKGVEIDCVALEEKLGVPVVPTIATRGYGVVELLSKALKLAANPSWKKAKIPTYDLEIEESIQKILQRFPSEWNPNSQIPSRFQALRLLEGDPQLEEKVKKQHPDLVKFAQAQRKILSENHNWPEVTVISSHRHAITMDLFEAVAKVKPKQKSSAREWMDRIIMNPFSGFLVAGLVLFSVFFISFFFGGKLAGFLGIPFEKLTQMLSLQNQGNFGWMVLKGFIDGFAGGLGIVLPYLLPLFFILSLLEDVGYIPRLAYLMDGLLHRIGLHGKSIVPFVLGYGCSGPALMGTRILESRRDRILTSLLIPLIPCSARTVVILALVGTFLGPVYAAGMYVMNIFIVGVVGRALSSFMPGPKVGLLMEVPPYRIPNFSSLLKKTWFRIYDFLLRTWPILIGASMVMAALEYLGASKFINHILSPLTVGILNLPEVLGVTLVFGILRKELSLILLFEALGTQNVASILSPAQILSFVVFIMLYVPCVASVTIQGRELGWRWAGISILINSILAIFVAWLVRICC